MQDMPKSDENVRFSIGQAANMLGISIDTLRRWEKAGKVKSLRSPGGHRYFTKDDLDQVFGKRYQRYSKPKQEEKPASTVEGSSPPLQEKKVDEQPVAFNENSTLTPTPEIKKEEEPQIELPEAKVETPQVSEPQLDTEPLEVSIKETQATEPEVINQENKKSSKMKPLLIFLAIFAVVDIILLIVYYVTSRPLLSPLT